MEDLSEKEQLDAIRAWWAENGSYVLGGVFVGIIAIFGWNQWRSGIADAEVAASTIFEEVMGAAGDGNLDAASAAAEELFRDYESTAYAAQARLALARAYMDNGRDQDAADVLSALVEAHPDSEIALVGRLRLAKILLYQDKAQEVVDLLKDQPETAFTARFNEMLGDAYFALGAYAEAEAAYVAALNDDPAVRTVDTNLIQLKINDLPPLDEAPASEPAVPDVSVDEPVDAAEEPAADEAMTDEPESGAPE